MLRYEQNIKAEVALQRHFSNSFLLEVLSPVQAARLLVRIDDFRLERYGVVLQ